MVNDLATFMKQARARQVMNDIRDGIDRNMPCGDQRIATLLVRFGALKLTNPKRRSFTSGFELTELGQGSS